MPGFSHVVEEHAPQSFRLDLYVSKHLNIISRSQIKARNVKALLNGKQVKFSHIVKKGDHLELNWEDLPPLDIIPQDIPLDIIYEDQRCIVINKAQGMVVHPGAGNRQGTLANALYFKMLERNSKTFIDNSNTDNRLTERPGIVHRLDKDTSGVMIAAYDDEAHAFLSGQFKARLTSKTYIAIVCGVPKEERGRIETFISRDPGDRKRFKVSANGRNAVTFYKTINKWQNHSLLLLHPRTGRTHQLRVHLKHIGCPILGDPVYGRSDRQFQGAALMLHSKSLSIVIPGETGQSVFSAPVPERFRTIINKLNGKENNDK